MFLKVLELFHEYSSIGVGFIVGNIFKFVLKILNR